MNLSTPAEIRTRARGLSASAYPGAIRSCFPYWDSRVRPFLLLSVNALPVQQFDFKPRPELFTARQLIVHIAEAEQGWISSLVDGGTFEDWLVPATAPAEGWALAVEAPDHTALVALLERAHVRTQFWLDQRLTELDRVFTSQPAEGPASTLTLHWILDRLQEHEIHHRAQLNLYLRLMGLDPPGI